MTAKNVPQMIDDLPPIRLDQINERAKLHIRKDRKYLVSPDALAPVLGNLMGSLQSLQIDNQRWFLYRSLYFDTPDLVSYRLAATRRPSRFKVRARTYSNNETTMIEVKTKDRRKRTVKVRHPYQPTDGSLIRATQDFARSVEEVNPHASRLTPLLAVTYRRATIAFREVGVRATIDTAFRADAENGKSASCGDRYIVETKTSGKPCALDRQLWRAGIRPVKISKYSTGLAAIQPELPSNRWHRVLENFSAAPTNTPTEPDRGDDRFAHKPKRENHTQSPIDHRSNVSDAFRLTN